MANWTDGLDEATLGHARLNGWAPEANADDVARAAVVKHLETSRLLRMPQDRLVVLPENADDPAWKDIHERLGAAKDPNEYKFEGVKFADGSELSDSLADSLRATAAKLHLSPVAAAALAQDVVKWADAQEATDTAARTAKINNDTEELRRNWGGNFEAFKFTADRAAALLGLTPEMVEAIAGQKGHYNTMEALRVMADRMGEARFVPGGGPGGGDKKYTREEALAEREALKTDQSWVKRYLEGGAAERAQMEHLTRTIVGPRY